MDCPFIINNANVTNTFTTEVISLKDELSLVEPSKMKYAL